MAGLRGAGGPAPCCGSRRVRDPRWVPSRAVRWEREIPLPRWREAGKPGTLPGEKGEGEKRWAFGVERLGAEARSVFYGCVVKLQLLQHWSG